MRAYGNPAWEVVQMKVVEGRTILVMSDGELITTISGDSVATTLTSLFNDGYELVGQSQAPISPPPFDCMPTEIYTLRRDTNR